MSCTELLGLHRTIFNYRLRVGQSAKEGRGKNALLQELPKSKLYLAKVKVNVVGQSVTKIRLEPSLRIS